jgi:hypothetical protein
MQHAGREIPVLCAARPLQETHQKIGILAAPSIIVGIETVDAVEIHFADRSEIA